LKAKNKVIPSNMNEELQFVLESTKEAMVNAVKHLEKEYLNIRAGKASPAMLGSVMVEYYGSQHLYLKLQT